MRNTFASSPPQTESQMRNCARVSGVSFSTAYRSIGRGIDLAWVSRKLRRRFWSFFPASRSHEPTPFCTNSCSSWTSSSAIRKVSSRSSTRIKKIRTHNGGPPFPRIAGFCKLMKNITWFIRQTATHNMRCRTIHQIPIVDSIMATDVKIEKCFAVFI